MKLGFNVNIEDREVTFGFTAKKEPEEKGFLEDITEVLDNASSTLKQISTSVSSDNNAITIDSDVDEIVDDEAEADI